MLANRVPDDQESDPDDLNSGTKFDLVNEDDADRGIHQLNKYEREQATNACQRIRRVRVSNMHIVRTK